MTASLHGNVANQIFQQVEQMIQKAKKDSEARVRYELTSTRSQLQGMETIIGELSERVARCTRANGLGTSDQPTVDRNFLNQKIQQLEQKWGSEVKALKQDLHRTILAHNHNSDLMRHHRDALDEARRKLDTMTQPKAEQVDAQIDKVDRMLRHGQAKQKELETLAQRLSSLEHQVTEIMPSGMPPFAGMMPGMNALLAQQAAQRGEAAAAAAAPKRPSKKEPSPAVADPTDEEMRRLLYIQMAAKGGRPNNLDPEAPIFVPKAPDSSSPAEADAAKAEEGDEAGAAKAEDDDEEVGAVKAEEGEDVGAPKAEDGDEAGATKAEDGDEAGAVKADEPEEAGTAKAEEGEEVPASDTVD